jgi:predicted anti-sigma-YlaC factor YlaD
MMNNSNNCEQISAQISGYLDGELTQQENQQVTVHLKNCPLCIKTYQDLQNLQSTIHQIPCCSLEEKKLASIVNDLTSKRMRTIAWFALVSGITILIMFLGAQFYFDPELAWYSKLAFSLICGGAIGLFLSVLRQRLIARKTDKYNKVKL